MNELQPLGRLLIVAGLVLAALGVLLSLGGKIPGLGRLPGDIVIGRGTFRLYIPLATSILLSLIVTGETDTTPVGAMGKITQLSVAGMPTFNPATNALQTNLMTASITAGAATHSSAGPVSSSETSAPSAIPCQRKGAAAEAGQAAKAAETFMKIPLRFSTQTALDTLACSSGWPPTGPRTRPGRCPDGSWPGPGPGRLWPRTGRRPGTRAVLLGARPYGFGTSGIRIVIAPRTSPTSKPVA